MNESSKKYCVNSGSPLTFREVNQQKRLACSDNQCDFVLWNNPIPVVGGIIETVKGVLLSHNKFWPDNVYSIITGFLEHQESPQAAILRELKEELGLTGSSPKLIGVYPFSERNQIILVYHIKAEGDIVLNDELDSIKLFTKEELKKWPFGQETLEGWPFGCGWAMRDWLNGAKPVLVDHE